MYGEEIGPDVWPAVSRGPANTNSIPMNLRTRIGRNYAMSSRFEELIAKASRGSTSAQIELGSCYLTGKSIDGENFPRNPLMAIYWLELAHKKGAYTASVILGQIYEKGEGVNIDIDKAISLYEIAEERGSLLPRLYLARIFAQGNSVAISKDKASSWYRAVLDSEDDVFSKEELLEASNYITTHGV